jgi:hypothetical protein
MDFMDGMDVLVLHVLERACGEVAAGQLAQRIARRDDAVLVAPARRTPAAAGHAGGQRGIERGAVHAGLPAAEDGQRCLHDRTVKQSAQAGNGAEANL